MAIAQPACPPARDKADGRSFIADRGDAALRLDQALLRRLADVPRLSRTRVQRWIGDGAVLVNGRPATRSSASVAAGDTVMVTTPEVLVTRRPPRPEELPLAVLFEDEYLLALDKPAGITVHPSYKHASGTLFNGLLAYVPSDAAGGLGPRLLHRLDRDTSGVLLVSKSLAIHRVVVRAMASGAVRKSYLAVVHGRPSPPHGRITLPLGPDPQDRRRVTVRPDGRASETRYERLNSTPGLSLLRCELVTGRMHQIRVHLQASGWPVAGDRVYGRPGDGWPRQALHAWRLDLTHPHTAEPLNLVADLPDDLRSHLARTGLGEPGPAQKNRTE
ncbi:MAG: RluA family pseudouridine synthase [Acidimicrobiia bacterium]|nr:RluA family pseudouridine synthase [Acidimicrobiia bacterium]